jgi:integrase/recombinase XerD
MDTGVRAKELCNINLEDVNLADSSILIRQGKGRKPRYVFFGKRTRKQIRKWISLRGVEGKALFASRENERVSYTTLREIMRRLSLKVGIKTPSLHAFRRAFCLECLRKGMSEITIARLMGHTTTQLIGRYAKQTTVDLMNSYKSPLDD